MMTDKAEPLTVTTTEGVAGAAITPERYESLDPNLSSEASGEVLRIANRELLADNQEKISMGRGSLDFRGTLGEIDVSSEETSKKIERYINSSAMKIDNRRKAAERFVRWFESGQSLKDAAEAEGVPYQTMFRHTRAITKSITGTLLQMSKSNKSNNSPKAPTSSIRSTYKGLTDTEAFVARSSSISNGRGDSFLPPQELPDPDSPLAWQADALCAQTDLEAFFPEKGGSTSIAKRACMACEVRVECLDYALENDERFGIWGGMSERERRKLQKGRASKVA